MEIIDQFSKCQFSYQSIIKGRYHELFEIIIKVMRWLFNDKNECHNRVIMGMQWMVHWSMHNAGASPRLPK
jgi:hypothetical protein